MHGRYVSEGGVRPGGTKKRCRTWHGESVQQNYSFWSKRCDFLGWEGLHHVLISLRRQRALGCVWLWKPPEPAAITSCFARPFLDPHFLHVSLHPKANLLKHISNHKWRNNPYVCTVVFATRFLPAPHGYTSEACSACPVTKEEVRLVHAVGMALVVAVAGHLPLFSYPTSTVLLLSTTYSFLGFSLKAKQGRNAVLLSLLLCF